MKKEWQREEQLLARRLVGKETKASGRCSEKGDVASEKYVAEQKYTTKDYYSLKFTLLDKISKEAWYTFKEPLFSVTITTRNYVRRFHLTRISEEVTQVKHKSYRVTDHSDGDIIYTPYGTWQVQEV